MQAFRPRKDVSNMKKHAGSVALIMALGVLLTSAASVEVAEEKKERDPYDSTKYGMGEVFENHASETAEEKKEWDPNDYTTYGLGGVWEDYAYDESEMPPGVKRVPDLWGCGEIWIYGTS